MTYKKKVCLKPNSDTEPKVETAVCFIKSRQNKKITFTKGLVYLLGDRGFLS